MNTSLDASKITNPGAVERALQWRGGGECECKYSLRTAERSTMECWKLSEPAYVDKVMISSHEEHHFLIKVLLRTYALASFLSIS